MHTPLSPWQPRLARCASLGVGVLLLSMGACGTALKDGNCKPATNSGYTASSHDPWGGEWQIKLSPETYAGTCATKGAVGSFRVVASIFDSQKVPRSGLAITAYLNSTSGDAFKIDTTQPSDTNTDSCGTAFFYVKWTCPDAAGDKHSGSLVVNSGALSKSIDVSIEYYVPSSGTN